MSDRANPFGQWLRDQRKLRGLTQRELAQQASCAEVTLRKIEAGDLRPSAQLVESLAQALGVDDADQRYILEFALDTGRQFAPVARKRKPRRPHSLPAQLTPLIGRELDVAAARSRLVDGARLVTLIGPPGVGKTRLALAVAESVLEQFEHGVFFVRLGPISDPDLVATTVAQSLGLQLNGQNPPVVQLRCFLENKHLLLVLDNLEHVVDSAPMLDDLLRRCPWLSMLVTSRQPLRVRGERQIPVHPLHLPAAIDATVALSAADALNYPAVELFADRAQTVLPSFAVTDSNAAAVAELCRRLDGLPLAIELVAARVKLMPPAELLAHLSGPWMLSVDGLRDVTARQKTLRGAIGWSYDLLAPGTQSLFARLAVFAGGCTLEAAETVCGDERAAGHVLDGIALLLDKSLLQRETGQHGEARYVMLETVREYAMERLEVSGESESTHARYLAYYAHMLREADQELYGPKRLTWYKWFDDEVHNVRAALATAIASDAQAALWMASTFADYLITRGRFDEARQWLERALTLPAAAPDTPARAWALVQLLRLDFYQWDGDWRWPHQEESLTVSRRLGYRRGIGESLFWLGWIAFHEGDRTRAAVNIAAALEIFQDTGNARRIVLSLCILGEIATEQGDSQRARDLLEESRRVALETGLRHSTDRTLGDLAELACRSGDWGEAYALVQQALEISRELGFQTHIAWQLWILGQVAMCRGDYSAARRALDEAMAMYKQWHDQWGIGATSFVLADLAAAEGLRNEALRLYRDSLSMMRLRRCQPMRPLLLQRLARIALDQGNAVLAAHLLGCAEAIQDATGLPMIPVEITRWESTLADLRAGLDAPILAAEWATGRTLNFEQAVGWIL